MVWPKGKPMYRQPRFPIRADTLFDRISTEKSAYFLGLLCADGYLPTRDRFKIGIDLNVKDVELLEALKETLGYEGEIRPTNHDMYRLIWTSRCMRATLERYGLDARKSKTLPGMLGVVDDQVASHFVRGYVDGDGGWHWMSNGVGLPRYLALQIRSTPAMCRWIRSVMPVPINYRFSKTGILYTKRLESVRSLGAWLYRGATVYLRRKKSIYDESVSGTGG